MLSLTPMLYVKNLTLQYIFMRVIIFLKNLGTLWISPSARLWKKITDYT